VKFLDDIRFELDPEGVFTHLRLDPSGFYAGEVHALLDQARERARPRALYDVASVLQKQKDAVVIASVSEGTGDGRCGSRVRFVSRVLCANLAEAERVFPYVATCGTELDTIPVAPDDVFGRFCLDAIKELALYAALARLVEHLQEEYEVGSLSSMNPGSGDQQVWPIEQQQELFSFLAGGPAALGVTLTASCLMIPNKTVSGLFFPCEDGFQSCQVCRREKCSHRRAPFDAQVWTERFGGA